MMSESQEFSQSINERDDSFSGKTLRSQDLTNEMSLTPS